MEFKGTKGEWKAVGKNVKINGELMSRKTYPQGSCVTTMELNLERMFSDAKLIASAPDLLEALQEIQIDLSILKSNFIEIEKTNSRAEGMTDIIDKWIERNKKAIEKALK